MRNTNFYRLLMCSAALLINSGCTEDSLDAGSTTSAPPTVIEPLMPPTAFAQADFQVILPTNFCWLYGSYGGNIKPEKTLWEKISGPSSAVIQNPDSLRTKVSNLEKGIYEFELTITNKNGLTAKDIARFVVGQMSETAKEIIFKDMDWVCPMGCYIAIENIYSHLPVGSVFRIYIQRDNSANWQEVVSDYSGGDHYTYALYDGHLYINLNDYPEPEDTPHNY